MTADPTTRPTVLSHLLSAIGPGGIDCGQGGGIGQGDPGRLRCRCERAEEVGGVEDNPQVVHLVAAGLTAAALAVEKQRERHEHCACCGDQLECPPRKSLTAQDQRRRPQRSSCGDGREPGIVDLRLVGQHQSERGHRGAASEEQRSEPGHLAPVHGVAQSGSRGSATSDQVSGRGGPGGRGGMTGGRMSEPARVVNSGSGSGRNG